VAAIYYMTNVRATMKLADPIYYTKRPWMYLYFASLSAAGGPSANDGFYGVGAGGRHPPNPIKRDREAPVAQVTAVYDCERPCRRLLRVVHALESAISQGDVPLEGFEQEGS
jgi:hypothetical protein